MEANLYTRMKFRVMVSTEAWAEQGEQCEVRQTSLCTVTTGTCVCVCLCPAKGKLLPHFLDSLIPVGQSGKPESAGSGCLAVVVKLVRELWNLELSLSCTDMPGLCSLQY